MATRKEVIEILKIAEKYDPDGNVAAEHDILYVLGENAEISEEDKKKLNELGADNYGDSMGWQVFV
jgi:tRNA pseudouridine-54 N-methylase